MESGGLLADGPVVFGAGAGAGGPRSPYPLNVCRQLTISLDESSSSPATGQAEQDHPLQVSVSVTKFSNRLLAIVSSFGKVGHLLSVTREAPVDPTTAMDAGGGDDVVTVERLLGAGSVGGGGADQDEDAQEVAGRYLAEQLMDATGMDSVLLGLSLKSYDRPTVKRSAQLIVDTVVKPMLKETSNTTQANGFQL